MRARTLDAKRIILISLVVILLALAAYVLTQLTVYKTAIFNREKIFTGAPQTTGYTGDFLSTTSEITVTAIHSGDLSVMLSNPVNLTHPAMAGVEDRPVTVPVYAYLIHHEKYGYFLIDSGCCGTYADAPYGTMSGPLVSRFVPQTQMDPNDAIEVQLADILPSLKGVFFTHLHFDHTSGVPDLPPDLLYFAGEGEMSVNITGLLEANHFDSTDVIYLFDFEKGRELPAGQAIDIFGDQSLWAISTPGHSAGHVSYLINTPDHPILIAGDAITTNDCLALGVSSGTSSSNQEKDQKTVDLLEAFLKEYPEVEVWCGHDEPVG